jgi:hypothetical protein
VLNFRYVSDQLIICLSQEIDEFVFPALGFDGNDDFGSGIPFLQKGRNHIRRVLEVRHHHDDSVTIRLEQRMVRRTDMAEISRIQDDLDSFVFRSHLCQYGRRIVVGTIVNEYMFERILRQLREYVFYTGKQFFDILLFIEARGDNADFFHCFILPNDNDRRSHFSGCSLQCIPPDNIPPDYIPPDNIPPGNIPPGNIPPDNIPPHALQ